MQIGPVKEGDDCPIQVTAGVGEYVLIPIGIAAITASLQKAVGHQVLEPRSEHISGDAKVAAHLSVAPNAVKGLSHDEDPPAIAEDVGNPLDPVCTSRSVVPGRQLVSDLRWIH
jgi:hypothetical protein